MREMVILLAILLVLALAALVLVLVYRAKSKNEDPGVGLIKGDLVELSRRLDSFSQVVGERIDKSSQNVNQSVQKQLEESSRLITEITTKLTKLDDTNKRVIDVADELKMLQDVLQNPKQRGNLGEYYLETVLANVLPPHVFQTQYGFNNGDIVDAVIHLDKGRILPIDSKFSLENYNRLITEKDKTLKQNHVKAFKSDLKRRIDETSKYIRPSEGTLDYAFMFIPSEAIYYDLLVNNVGATGTNARDLIEYAFIDRKVIIVSPTTLLAYLQTVMQGLRSLQIEEQAKDIQKSVGQLEKHIQSHEVYMQKLGNSLGTTVNHFNNAHKSFERMDKAVVKIADTSPSVESILIDRPPREE